MRETPLSSQTAEHVPALDGLRGVAVMAVMLFHYVTAPAYGADAFVTRKLVGLAVSLWSGVDLFFVLSGFLITGILRRAREKPGYFKNFYMRRALRIFPLYYASLVVIFLVLPHLMPTTPGVQRIYDSQAWLWGYSEDLAILVHNEDYFDRDWLWVGHFWSLAVEEHFYLVWPLVVYLCRRRTLVLVSLALIAVTPMLRGLMLLRGLDHAMIYTQTFSRTDGLALGGLVAVAAEHFSYRQLSRYAGWAVAASSAYVITAMVIQGGPLWWGHWTVLGPGFTALALGGAGLIVFSLSPHRNLLKTAIDNRFLRTMGKYSYGAYVIHTPLEPLLLRWIHPSKISALFAGLGHGASRLAGVIGFATIGIGLTVTLAVLSFHLFERPFLRLKRYFEYDRGAAPSQVRAA